MIRPRLPLSSPTILLSLLIWFAAVIPTHIEASAGDNDFRYQRCLGQCYQKVCNNGTELYSSDKLPTALQLTFWNCQDNCKYDCMWYVVEKASLDGKIDQYYGKWPFIRVFGIQEPASVLFSILNGWCHYQGYLLLTALFRAQALRRPIGRSPRLASLSLSGSSAAHDSKSSYFLKPFYIAYAFLGMNAWFWSTIFHIRDKPWTEKMDYFSAGALVLYTTYYTVIKVFHIRNRLYVRFLTLICLSMFTAHISYLSFWRFDYFYNMLANTLVGLFQNICWLVWVAKNRKVRPHAWKIGLVVISLSSAMSLELLDFPPYKFIIDAHALWHAATIPIVYLVYNFFKDDILYEMEGGVRGMSGISSSGGPSTSLLLGSIDGGVRKEKDASRID